MDEDFSRQTRRFSAAILTYGGKKTSQTACSGCEYRFLESIPKLDMPRLRSQIFSKQGGLPPSKGRLLYTGGFAPAGATRELFRKVPWSRNLFYPL